MMPTTIQRIRRRNSMIISIFSSSCWIVLLLLQEISIVVSAFVLQRLDTRLQPLDPCYYQLQQQQQQPGFVRVHKQNQQQQQQDAIRWQNHNSALVWKLTTVLYEQRNKKETIRIDDDDDDDEIPSPQRFINNRPTPVGDELTSTTSTKSRRRVVKPPRFTQSVHNTNKNNTNNTKKKVTDRSQDDDNDSFFRRSNPKTSTTTSTRQSVSSRSSSSITTTVRKMIPVQDSSYTDNDVQQPLINKKDTTYRKDRMWKNSKSIDELEGTLLKRWGTDLSKWTATDIDNDDDDDDDDDEYEYNDNDDATSSSNQGTSTSSNAASPVGTQFRARPVKDPLLLDDNNDDDDNGTSNLSSTKKPSKLFTTTTTTKSQLFQALDDPITRRVLSNQRKIQQNRNNSLLSSTTTIDNQQQSQPNRRFNDEEINALAAVSSSPDTSILNINHLIPKSSDTVLPTFPKPNKSIQQQQQPQQQQQQKSSSSSSFFFSEGPLITTTTGDEPEVPEQPSQRLLSQPKVRSETIPLYNLDDNTPMYLTLEQAERNFILANQGNQIDSDDADGSGTRKSEDTAKQTWEDIGITNPVLLKNLNGKKLACRTPMYVQKQATPEILRIPTQDVVIGTYTGSGKTLAFLVPTIQQLLSEQQDEGDTKSTTAFLKVVIIAPGRELASQIVSVARDIIQDVPNMNVMLAIGGTTYSRNLEQIRKKKPAILVGTPGRIAELLVGRPGESGGSNNGRIKLSGIRTLILDEFDALLEYKPHRDPTEAIVQVIQKQQRDRVQTIFCSATASDMMSTATGNPNNKLQRFLRPNNYITVVADKNDVSVTPGTSTSGDTNGSITRVSKTVIHGVVHVEHKRYVLDTLRKILHTDPIPQQILIFVENARKVDLVVDKLAEMNIVAAPLHGGMGSEKDDRAYVNQAFREGYLGIVVATELAARGIDAPLLTHVINIDLPTDVSHYAHRAGRCGRGPNKPGVVISLTTSPAERNVPAKLTSALQVPLYTVEVKNGKLNIIDPKSLPLD